MENSTLCCSCRIVDVGVSFRPQELARPLELSTGRIEDITESRASVTVETNTGQRATGRGVIYLSDLWAWPTLTVPRETREKILIGLTERIGARLTSLAGGSVLHPLELVSYYVTCAHGAYAARRLLKNWLSRRSDKRRMNWEKFHLMERRFSLPAPRVTVSMC